MQKILNIFLIMSITSILSATTIIGKGYGEVEKEAKKEALADLSNQISVDVKSEFKTIVKTLGDNFSKSNEKMLNISSNLPLKGVEFDKNMNNNLIESIARISTQKALRVYLLALKRLKSSISNTQKEIKNIKSKDGKYILLNNLLQDIQSFIKHKTVATILGGSSLPSIDITKAEVISQIQQLQLNIPTIKIASEVLAKGINKKDIYLSAIKPSGSNEVTQFAKILKDNMKSRLNTTKYSIDADYFLKGSYEILKDSIFITMNLTDKNSNIIKTNTATLTKEAYQNTKYKPITKTFDKAMNDGFVKSGNLSVNIGFKGYSRDDGIDLNGGDSVDIVVKTNKPICYFLLAHTLKKSEKFSYLLPIGSDNSPYINYLTGSDVNRNIVIADGVPIEAPFGSENLQIFASTIDKSGKCFLKAPRCIENSDGYCVVNGTPGEVIHTTRGLAMHRRKQKIEQAENSISWTSFKNARK